MKTVKLSRRYVVGSATFDSVTFREPQLKDYRQIGKVAELQKGVVVSYADAIWSYADRLLEDGLNPGALGELDLIDALAIEDAVLGFFTKANRRLNERGNSSSASAGAPTTSTG